MIFAIDLQVKLDNARENLRRAQELIYNASGGMADLSLDEVCGNYTLLVQRMRAHFIPSAP